MWFWWGSRGGVLGGFFGLVEGWFLFDWGHLVYFWFNFFAANSWEECCYQGFEFFINFLNHNLLNFNPDYFLIFKFLILSIICLLLHFNFLITSIKPLFSENEPAIPGQKKKSPNLTMEERMVSSSFTSYFLLHFPIPSFSWSVRVNS